jgi:MFS family permease
MLVFMAFGMVFGALTIPRFEHRVRLQWLFGGSVMAFGLALLGFASVTRYGIAGIFAMVAGACIATLSVAGNGYVVRTTSDELRGRVFTALESVQRLSLLLSMIVMAPIADVIGKFVYDFAVNNRLTTQTVYWTGSRITLQLSSFIVMGAAIYAFRSLRWSPSVAAPLPAVTLPAEKPADA